MDYMRHKRHFWGWCQGVNSGDFALREGCVGGLGWGAVCRR